MSDIFREVDEEIRHERYAELWKRYGLWIIGVALALVLAVAGYQGWEAYQRSQARDASQRYADALAKIETQSPAAAIQALESVAGSAPEGYALLARLRTAALQAETGEIRAAVATWDAIADNAETPAPFRTLATLFSVMNRMVNGDAAALSRELKPIAEGDGAFRATAVELQAVLAMKQNQTARAIELYKRIADGAQVPAQQRQRATQMLAQLEG